MKLFLTQKHSFRKQNIYDSSIFYIFNKSLKKNFYYKNHNKVWGKYKDPVLKDFIFVSSSGLKKTTVFRKSFNFQDNLSLNQYNFVSYFSFLDNDFFRFTLHSKKYLNITLRNHILNQKKFIKINKKLNVKFFTLKKKSKFNKVFFTLSNLKKLTVLGNVNNWILIKQFYKKAIFFTNNTGFFIKENFSKKKRFKFFSHLLILNRQEKHSFLFVCLLNHLLPNYFSETWHNWQQSFGFLLKLSVYFLMWKYFKFKHYYGLYRKRREYLYDSIRHNIFKPVTNQIIKTYYYIVLQKYKAEIKKNHKILWLNEIIFFRNNIFWFTENEELETLSLMLKINSLNFVEKVYLLKKLLIYIPTLFNSFRFESFRNIKFLFNYYFFYSLIIDSYLSLNFRFFKSYLQPTLISTIENIFFIKTTESRPGLYSLNDYLYHLFQVKFKKNKIKTKLKTFFLKRRKNNKDNILNCYKNQFNSEIKKINFITKNTKNLQLFLKSNTNLTKFIKKEKKNIAYREFLINKLCKKILNDVLIWQRWKWTLKNKKIHALQIYKIFKFIFTKKIMSFQTNLKNKIINIFSKRKPSYFLKFFYKNKKNVYSTKIKILKKNEKKLLEFTQKAKLKFKRKSLREIFLARLSNLRKFLI